ncbi:quinate 5-dehydrogenase [Candidatus Leptofilum sp.]|uniref:quinate 5-dehydrogenase n=1 Tax=Candidatus Leptofilum sp. TaxID=3241576 RepID=UPI003B591FAA
MKHAVSVSLGSSERDKKVEIELLGQRVSVERRGTDGDIAKATALFTELDGQVDCLGVGGIDLWIKMEEKTWNISAAHKLIQGVKQTPVVDGSGLKNTLEAYAAQTLVAELGAAYAQGRVLLTAAIDRYGMTKSFVAQGYEIVFGDLMFALGIPIAIRKFSTFQKVAKLLAAPATKLPISVLYPTGDKQDQIIPKFTKWYEWATVIGGDCHYIKQHMPDDLTGKVIVTNTTTPKDMQLFKQRGVTHVLTTTPVLDGRSFGTNMMEAAITAVSGKNRPLTNDELNEMLAELNLKPTVHSLS